VNDLRKQAGLALDDRIHLQVEAGAISAAPSRPTATT